MSSYFYFCIWRLCLEVYCPCTFLYNNITEIYFWLYFKLRNKLVTQRTFRIAQQKTMLLCCRHFKRNETWVSISLFNISFTLVDLHCMCVCTRTNTFNCHTTIVLSITSAPPWSMLWIFFVFVSFLFWRFLFYLSLVYFFVSLNLLREFTVFFVFYWVALKNRNKTPWSILEILCLI